jgi:hypothetical protein
LNDINSTENESTKNNYDESEQNNINNNNNIDKDDEEDYDFIPLEMTSMSLPTMTKNFNVK